MSRRVCACFFFLFLLDSISFSSSSTIPIDNSSRREVIKALNGAVATDDGRCSEIARDVLREGGHAVDASVAAALCLGVVSPASSGIGGGAFMLIRSADGKAQAFDMRETAPGLASQDMYSGKAEKKASGGLSVAIPGELAGLHRAWKQYGKLQWKRLVNPAARLAENGFTISKYLRMQMETRESSIKADEGLRRMFAPGGNLLGEGQMCRNIQLARTLRQISRYGIGSFYNGSIGFNLVRDVRKAGGILRMEDLKQYQVKVRRPVVTDILGLKVLGMPPPSSGGSVMALILNILAQFGFRKNVSSSLEVHRQIEALKHGFAMRMNLGDPDYVDLKDVLSDLRSKRFANQLKKMIYDNRTFNSSYYGGRWNQVHDHGTSHLSIVDRDRNAISMTTTINAYFGAKFLSTSTGIILNNEMDDFSIPMKVTAGGVPPPAPANFIHPFKRPLSSMSPTIVLKGKHFKATLGASGGAMIIGGTTEVFWNHFVKGMDPLSSVMAPRYYHPLIPDILSFENWTTVTGDHFELPADIRQDLQKKGHVLESIASGTVCQFVNQDDSGQLVAVSDPRKGGFPAGY